MKKLDIFIAHHSCDITYQHITSGQKLAAFFDAEFLDIIPKGHAGFLLETTADIGNIIVFLLTKFLKVNRLMIVSLCKMENLIYNCGI